SQAGTWSSMATGGYGGSYRYAPGGDGGTQATWQYTGLPQGTYDLAMTWVSAGNRATNAPYLVYDGTTLLATVPVNQQIAPAGLSSGGTTFQSLGRFPVASGKLRVVLGNGAN